MIKEVLSWKKEISIKGLHLFLFIFSLCLVAIGQSDRLFIFPLLSFLIGYLIIFFLVSKVEGILRRVGKLFLWAFLVNLYQLGWLGTNTYHGNGIYLAYLLVVSVVSLHFSLLAYFFPSEGKLFTIRRILFIASLYTLLEYSKMFYSAGFPFNNVGLVLAFHPIPMQIASIFGVFGLTFWVIVTALLGCNVLLKPGKATISGYLFATLLPFFLGSSLYFSKLKEISIDQKYYALLVQTGLLPEQKWEFSEDQDAYITPIEQWIRILSYINQSGRREFDYIILPEGAMPADAYDPIYSFEEVQSALVIPSKSYPPFEGRAVWSERDSKVYVSNAWLLQALSNMYKAEVIAGVLENDEINDISYNSAFHFTPFTSEPSRYDKRLLVPMAEYLPIKAFGSFLEKFGISRFFTPGDKATLFYGKQPISTSICFEEGFSYLVHEGRKNGARMFVNVTNDAWFPYSRLPQEHFNMGLVRSAENGVYSLRACNTGITAIIDPLGRVVDKLDNLDVNGKYQAGALVIEIENFSIDTVYAKHGDSLILFLCSAIIALGALGILLKQILTQRHEILPLLKKEDMR